MFEENKNLIKALLNRPNGEDPSDIFVYAVSGIEYGEDVVCTGLSVSPCQRFAEFRIKDVLVLNVSIQDVVIELRSYYSVEEFLKLIDK